eukprot:CAMPEP_0118937476 /NCGR_PEP_ID=MMETSP1169-20130426/22910_1 /TAXON_ID=36882 /ORGANISM="Pyramimonas obovata, Strain CCMP722" /LENGTH=97 /DNA_ID=CAMNT_0006881121 /DNA_START=1 /DNA_END=294 /DNA_ORIENTATION=-
MLGEHTDTHLPGSRRLQTPSEASSPGTCDDWSQAGEAERDEDAKYRDEDARRIMEKRGRRGALTPQDADKVGEMYSDGNVKAHTGWFATKQAFDRVA